MALKLVVDKLEDLPEEIRTLYTAGKDGKFALDVDGIEDTGLLKKSIADERKARKLLEEKVKSWEKLGKTPDEIEELTAAVAKAEEEKLEHAGEWTQLKAQMNAKHDADVKALQAKIDAKEGEIKSRQRSLESLLIETQATAAIAAAKGVPELLLPHVARFVKVDEVDGRLVTKIVDLQGGPRVNGKGDPLTVEDLINEMKASEKYGRAFESSGNSGSGSGPNGSGGAGADSKYKKRSDFGTERERAEFVDKHGIETYLSLPSN